MALKKCKECNYTVSTQADSCPNCGAPVKAKGGSAGGCGILIIIIFALVVIGNLLDTDSSTTKTATPSKPIEVVSNSAWDASVWQVKRYLKDNLKDPDSFEAIDWSEVIKVDVDTLPHKYIVRCKYRAKNSFGGYVVENQLFYLDRNGNVISSRDIGS